MAVPITDPSEFAGRRARLENITIVIMTRDRVDELAQALERLRGVGLMAKIVVVDNGSADGTAMQVTRRFPEVKLITLDRNAGVAARNLAVRAVDTPYVAFNDDDSWWELDSLVQVVRSFDAHPRLGAVTAHVLVGPDHNDDPVSLEMRCSPVEDGHEGIPGIPVLGFLACATAVRRSAFLEVGGFNEQMHFYGEEELLATDLMSGGWAVRYLPELVVHHHPSGKRNATVARRRALRNTLWFLWMRRPVRTALTRSVALLRATRWDLHTVGALTEALSGMPGAISRRRVVPPHVERCLVALEKGR